MEMTFSDGTTYFLYHYPLQVLILSLHSNPQINSVQEDLSLQQIICPCFFFMVPLSNNIAFLLHSLFQEPLPNIFNWQPFLIYSRTSHKRQPKIQRLGGCLRELDRKGEILKSTQNGVVNYSKKILKVYFPLTITGSFYDKIISYSM